MWGTAGSASAVGDLSAISELNSRIEALEKLVGPEALAVYSPLTPNYLFTYLSLSLSLSISKRKVQIW